MEKNVPSHGADGADGADGAEIMSCALAQRTTVLCLIVIVAGTVCDVTGVFSRCEIVPLEKTVFFPSWNVEFFFCCPFIDLTNGWCLGRTSSQ